MTLWSYLPIYDRKSIVFLNQILKKNRNDLIHISAKKNLSLSMIDKERFSHANDFSEQH